MVASPAIRPMTPRPFRIEAVRPETPNVFTWTLRPTQEDGPLVFQPGQFNMLSIFGVGEVPISVSGDAEQSEILVHTDPLCGTVTQVMETKKAGEIVGVRGPFGNTWPLQAAEGCDVVLAVGGLGLAPMRPTIYHVLHHRERYKRVYLLMAHAPPKISLIPTNSRRGAKAVHWISETTVDVGMDGMGWRSGPCDGLDQRYPYRIRTTASRWYVDPRS